MSEYADLTVRIEGHEVIVLDRAIGTRLPRSGRYPRGDIKDAFEEIWGKFSSAKACSVLTFKPTGPPPRRRFRAPPVQQTQIRRRQPFAPVIQPRSPASAASSAAGATSSAGSSPKNRLPALHCASARSAFGPASHPRVAPVPCILSVSLTSIRSDTRQCSNSILSLEPTPFALRAPTSSTISAVGMRPSGDPAAAMARSRSASTVAPSLRPVVNFCVIFSARGTWRTRVR